MFVWSLDIKPEFPKTHVILENKFDKSSRKLSIELFKKIKEII